MKLKEVLFLVMIGALFSPVVQSYAGHGGSNSPDLERSGGLLDAHGYMRLEGIQSETQLSRDVRKRSLADDLDRFTPADSTGHQARPTAIESIVEELLYEPGSEVGVLKRIWALDAVQSPVQVLEIELGPGVGRFSAYSPAGEGIYSELLLLNDGHSIAAYVSVYAPGQGWMDRNQVLTPLGGDIASCLDTDPQTQRSSENGLATAAFPAYSGLEDVQAPWADENLDAHLELKRDLLFARLPSDFGDGSLQGCDDQVTNVTCVGACAIAAACGVSGCGGGVGCMACAVAIVTCAACVDRWFRCFQQVN